MADEKDRDLLAFVSPELRAKMLNKYPELRYRRYGSTKWTRGSDVEQPQGRRGALSRMRPRGRDFFPR